MVSGFLGSSTRRPVTPRGDAAGLACRADDPYRAAVQSRYRLSCGGLQIRDLWRQVVVFGIIFQTVARLYFDAFDQGSQLSLPLLPDASLT